jgi:2-polyprenyl-3-methyl-5-hydroxy-6-metoxy-1,4-benzoquinol methylase
MKEQWNQRYSSNDFIYGILPNAFFKSNIDNQNPGKILLPAEGEGRNAVYAASSGWNVTAIDFSEKGKEKAMLLARLKGIEIKYHLANIHEYNFTGQEYDMIALIFCHMKAGQRISFHKKMVQLLKPGGTLILQAFNKEQILRNTGGPKDESMLYTIEEIRSDFIDLNILSLENAQLILNEGELHKGFAELINFVGIKE